MDTAGMVAALRRVQCRQRDDGAWAALDDAIRFVETHERLMAGTSQLWVPEPHKCRDCGGRVLRCVYGAGPTPGGDPVYRCADCGVRSSGAPRSVCWCGFAHRAQPESPTSYRCVEFPAADDTSPRAKALREALAACGCRPGRQEIGVVLFRDLMAAMQLPGDTP